MADECIVCGEPVDPDYDPLCEDCYIDEVVADDMADEEDNEEHSDSW